MNWAKCNKCQSIIRNEIDSSRIAFRQRINGIKEESFELCKLCFENFTKSYFIQPERLNKKTSFEDMIV